MKLAHVKISNILGITELEFTPEGFNEFAGPNGTGKTSALEAIKSAIQGGHDATLLRKGEQKGEVVLVLDDGTELKKRVSERQSTIDITRDGKKVARPTELLKSLTDMLSVNPVDFLRAPKKDRVRVLLETMPIEADTDKLTVMTGIPVKAQPGLNGLQVIDLVKKQVFDDRTGTNRAIKEKDATINQLRLAMPEAPAGAAGNEQELVDAISSADTAKQGELDRVRDKLDGIRTTTNTAIAKAKEVAQLEIDRLNGELASIEDKAAKQRELTIARHTEAVAPLNAALSAIRADRTNSAKREQAEATIKVMVKELEDLETDAKSQTKSLDDIEAYKASLLAALPIPGLEVIDGEIYRNGVHFDRLNTAQQVDIAVEIAKLRAGELGVVCVDGIELLDTAAFESFRDRALASGLQLFVTRVSDEEFGVRTTN